ncbi:hypothetical protein [Vallitalea okinawensis]|uniref:hypothetical protein n=1 Tax=Vallitalea okinawensis TaxID=2078660 RepID=UPI000CFAFD96|nr:hypothetical protein [Vallitalea okinawensis]
MVSRNLRTRVMALIVCLSLMMQMVNMHTMKVQAASEIDYRWQQGSGLTNRLEIQSETQDDKALFYWDFEETGDYILDYFLKDNSKVEVTVKKKDDNTLDLYYRVYQYDGSDWNNITHNISSDYQEVDYKTTPVNFLLEDASPNLVDVTSGLPFVTTGSSVTLTTEDPAVLFEDITKGSLYPGATFKMNSKTVHFMWEDTNDRFYFQTDGIEPGKVTPFILSYTSNDSTTKGPYIIEVLTKLDGFAIKPTHYYVDGGINNKTILEDVDTAAGMQPGASPGFDLTFNHPMIWNYSTNQYEEDSTLFDSNNIVGNFYISEYGSDGISTSLSIDLNKDDALNPFYNVDGLHTYTTKLVADSTVADVSSSDEYVYWSDLKSSTIYEVEVYIKKVDGADEENNFDRSPFDYDGDGNDETPNVQFMTYIPDGGYAYTYLEYVIKRESIDEAYLEVTPYQGIEDDVIKYDVYISPEKAWLIDGEEIDTEKWLTYTHEIGTDPYEGKLYIPVKFEGGSGLYYKIKISFDGQENSRKLYTQLLHYTSQPDELVPPSITKIEDISDIKVLPSETGSVEDPPAQITIDVTWKAPEEELLMELLGTGDLYYELLINEEPKNGTGSKSFDIIKVFKVSINGSGDVEVTEESGTSSGSNEHYYVNGYNDDNNTFRVDDVVFKSEETDPDEGWMKVYDVSSDEQIEAGTYTPVLRAGDIEYDGIKELPNVNFLRMRTVYMRNTDTDADYEDGSYSNLSIAKGLSLSHTEVGVPSVTNIQHENIMTGTSNIKFELGWDIADIRNFEEYMLKPVGKAAQDVYYEVYISQNKDSLEHVNLGDYETDNGTSTFSQYVDASSAIPSVDLSAQLDNLRNDEVVSIKVKSDKDEYLGTEKFYIEGVDSNQVYHIEIVTRIEVDTDDIRRSTVSPILSFTTLNIDGPVQIMPLVPEDFSVIEILSSSTIKLGWVINMEEVEPDETIGYEIVRVEGKTLNDSFSATTPQEEIIESGVNATNGEESIVGWRIVDADGNGYTMDIYNPKIHAWESVTNNHDVTLGNVTMIDDMLEPNEVYYYYLRAVRVEKDTDGDTNLEVNIDRNKPASEWTALTYTSEPLKAPINLTQDYYKYSYDEYYEAIIYFDVAIPEAGIAAYVPEIYIYSQDDANYNDQYHFLEDFVLLGDSATDDTIQAPEGYVRYYYEIQELTPGKNYSVKVRVRTNEDDPNYSSYSDRITIRTEFDEDTYEREHLLNYYMEYYDLKTDELYRTIYWIAEDTDEILNIKYRQYEAIDELRATAGNEYSIDVSDHEELLIYLPHPLINTMEEDDIGFTIKSDDLSVTLNSETLRKSKVDEFEYMIEEVDDSSGLHDYFIKIELDLRDYNSNINGQKTVSDLMKLNIELVASDSNELNLEEKIFGKLESLIYSNRTSVEQKLIVELDKLSYDEEELLEIVDEEVEDIRNNHGAYVKNEIETVTYKNPTETLYEVYEPITISLNKNDNSAIGLYKRNNSNWIKLDTTSNAFEIYSDVETTGEYIFAGFTQEELIDDSAKNADQINDLLIKYSLTDFFTIADLSDVSQEITKYNFIYSMARVLGAPEDANAVEWLEEQGIEGVTNKHIQDSIANGDAYYLMVQCYAYKGDMDLESVRISNRFAIKDIDETQPDYKDTLLRGAELGVIELDRGYMKPDESMSIEDYLNALIKIEYRSW